ncbi:hypothetical protein F5X68DRAFT_78685 [Plectosphaerella plurivora]|uniref:Uncharacterized protein n=1 Tax=Plectosphaerella plurivora TaxID=936078 RepID=A0A9P9ADC1_9PEZI|nr:hypothetical protein F5X68DRAFT_78685 [Plectosphaerella plurivora]
MSNIDRNSPSAHLPQRAHGVCRAVPQGPSQRDPAGTCLPTYATCHPSIIAAANQQLERTGHPSTASGRDASQPRRIVSSALPLRIRNKMNQNALSPDMLGPESRNTSKKREAAAAAHVAGHSTPLGLSPRLQGRMLALPDKLWSKRRRQCQPTHVSLSKRNKPPPRTTWEQRSLAQPALPRVPRVDSPAERARVMDRARSSPSRVLVFLHPPPGPLHRKVEMAVSIVGP